uniref:Uncharacterized protein isoform X2 n=1 Tax=Nicotiana tabacum TaxID=4097 RepID=A0A1S4A1F7_TOBAC|nr:PREDICTED: uncharacterized protein LOC107792751 isoform X2 [Nicotiana tabacum]
MEKKSNCMVCVTGGAGSSLVKKLLDRGYTVHAILRNLVKRIGMACLKSGTVKKLIYTASVVAASPLKDDGSGFNDLMDEMCWTPFNFSNPYADQGLRGLLNA